MNEMLTAEAREYRRVYIEYWLWKVDVAPLARLQFQEIVASDAAREQYIVELETYYGEVEDRLDMIRMDKREAEKRIAELEAQVERLQRNAELCPHCGGALMVEYLRGQDITHTPWLLCACEKVAILPASTEEL